MADECQGQTPPLTCALSRIGAQGGRRQAVAWVASTASGLAAHCSFVRIVSPKRRYASYGAGWRLWRPIALRASIARRLELGASIIMDEPRGL